MNRKKLFNWITAIGSFVGLVVFLCELFGLSPFGASGVVIMAAITGTRTTQNTDPSNKSIDITSRLVYKQNYQTPILQWFVLNKLSNKKTKESRGKFRWREKSPLSRVSTLTAGLSGGATTEASVAVADVTLFRQDDTFIVESTGEILRVTNDPSVTLNLIKVGGGNITAAGAGATVRLLAPAKKEDYTRQKPLSNDGAERSGYCQIGLDSLAITGREDAASRYVEEDGDFKRLVDEKIDEISKYEERKFLYNTAAYDDNTNNITYSWGARGAYTQNVKYYSGQVDETELDDFLETYMAMQDSRNIVAYCGSKYISGLNKFLKEAFHYNTDDYIRVYGGLSKKPGSTKLLTYMSPWGNVDFCWQPFLEGEVFSNDALFLNRDHIMYRFMQNDQDGSRKFRIEPDVQDLGSGVFQDQFMWDTGFQPGPDEFGGWHRKS